jgi:rhamnosyltransferase
MTSISVVIRSFNSASTIEATLRSVRSQTIRAEIVLVDSGSTDETLTVAAPYVDRLVTMRKSEFSFGRALNRGFEASSGEILHPLSSHCTFQHERHLARVLELHVNEQVAATNGESLGPSNGALTATIFVREWPTPKLLWWGFSNHSSSVRRSVWAQIPFDERLPACEDKEWAQRVYATDPSWTIAFDPKLRVPATHRTKQGLKHLYRRGFIEGYALQSILPDVVLSAPTVLQQWVFWAPPNGRLPAAAYGLMPLRWWQGLAVLRGAHAASGDRTPTAF